MRVEYRSCHRICTNSDRPSSCGCRTAFPYGFGNAALLSAASVQGTCAGQRFVLAIFSSRVSRSKRSAHHVRDCAENGAHHRGSERIGGAPGESWLRGAFGCAGRSPQSDGLHHAERLRPGTTDSRGNGTDSDESTESPHALRTKGLTADLR